MGLHIVCLHKQQRLPPSNIQIDPVTGTLKREGMAAGHQPLRRVRHRGRRPDQGARPGQHRFRGHMGPPQAEEALREIPRPGLRPGVPRHFPALSPAPTPTPRPTPSPESIEAHRQGERSRLPRDLRQADQRRRHPATWVPASAPGWTGPTSPT